MAQARARTLATLVPLAQAQVAAQLDAAASSQNLGLSLLTVTIALIGSLTAARLADHHLTQAWPLPMLGLVISFVVLWWAVGGWVPHVLRQVLDRTAGGPLPDGVDAGPTPEQLFELVRGRDEVDAYVAVLAELRDTVEANRHALSVLGSRFARGQQVLGVTLICGLLLLGLLSAI